MKLGKFIPKILISCTFLIMTSSVPIFADTDAPVIGNSANIEKFEGFINGNSVNIRRSPSHDGEIITRADYGQYIQVLEIQDEWCVIEFDGTFAYVHKDFISVPSMNEIPAREPQTQQQADRISAVVNTNNLFLYEDASTGSQIVTVLSAGDILEVVSNYNDEWIQVSVNGQVGFVGRDSVSLQMGQASSGSQEARAGEIVDFAKRYLGIPYRSGGTNLQTGVDCSGFTFAVMKNFGITLGRSSRDQVLNGRAVTQDELKPTDLLFFNTGGNSTISHVGMYIGGGQYIHSSTTKVVISDLSSDYSRRTYVTARRIIE